MRTCAIARFLPDTRVTAVTPRKFWRIPVLFLNCRRKEQTWQRRRYYAPASSAGALFASQDKARGSGCMVLVLPPLSLPKSRAGRDEMYLLLPAQAILRHSNSQKNWAPIGPETPIKNLQNYSTAPLFSLPSAPSFR